MSIALHPHVILADSCDVNVNPDKRTIVLHSENNLIQALRVSSIFIKTIC